MKSPFFHVPESPLDGKRVPLDWKRLDLTGKRRALVHCGLARSYEHACSILGKHAGAVQRERKRRELEKLEKAEERKAKGKASRSTREGGR